MPLISTLANASARGYGFAGLSLVTDDYESIGTFTLGSNQTTITFSSIPSTYKHLQIRALAGNNNGGIGVGSFYVKFNSDSGSNYSWHRIYGDGETASVSSVSSTTAMDLAVVGFAGNTNPFGAVILDILDYTNTGKNTTCRSLAGSDRNGAGTIAIYSGAWYNTAAVTNIDITTDSGNQFTTNSRFALYGIRG